MGVEECVLCVGGGVFVVWVGNLCSVGVGGGGGGCVVWVGNLCSVGG